MAVACAIEGSDMTDRLVIDDHTVAAAEILCRAVEEKAPDSAAARNLHRFVAQPNEASLAEASQAFSRLPPLARLGAVNQAVATAKALPRKRKAAPAATRKTPARRSSERIWRTGRAGTMTRKV
jgi:hypothetical protein